MAGNSKSAAVDLVSGEDTLRAPSHTKSWFCGCHWGVPKAGRGTCPVTCDSGEFLQRGCSQS